MYTLPDTIDTLHVLLVDRSGSMGSLRYPTIEGMNTYLNTQKEKKVPNAFVFLFQFDTNQTGLDLTTVFEMVPLEKTRMLGLEDFQPRGATPLYDAIGTIITRIRQSVEGAKYPPSVIFQIITDGAENSSREYDSQKVTALIKELEATGGWTFTYSGTNHDVMAAAGSIGISAANTVQYDAGLISETFSTMAQAASAYSLMNSSTRSVDKSARASSKALYTETGIDTTGLSSS